MSKPESRKDSIAKTARELFREKGYNQVTVMDICDTCHITKPTFYKHIGSKENLILDFYDLPIQTILDSYTLLNADSSYQQLIHIFQALLECTLHFGRDIFSQMFIFNLNQNHHSFDMREDLTKLCELIIENAQKAGEIQNPCAASTLYRSIAYMFTGYECIWCIGSGESDWKANFFTSVETILMVRENLLGIWKTTN